MATVESPKTESAPTKVEAPAAVAAESKTAKGVQVSTTLPADLHAALEDHRWDVRLTMTDLVRRALEEYAANHKVSPKA